MSRVVNFDSGVLGLVTKPRKKTDEDRAAFRKVWRRRVADAWKSGEVGLGNGHLTRPLNSHGNRVWHKIAEAAIAMERAGIDVMQATALQGAYLAQSKVSHDTIHVINEYRRSLPTL